MNHYSKHCFLLLLYYRLITILSRFSRCYYSLNWFLHLEKVIERSKLDHNVSFWQTKAAAFLLSELRFSKLSFAFIQRLKDFAFSLFI